MLNLDTFTASACPEGSVQRAASRVSIVLSGSLSGKVKKLRSFDYLIKTDEPAAGTLKVITKDGEFSPPSNDWHASTYRFPAPYTGSVTFEFVAAGWYLSTLDLYNFVIE